MREVYGYFIYGIVGVNGAEEAFVTYSMEFSIFNISFFLSFTKQLWKQKLWQFAVVVEENEFLRKKILRARFV